MRIVLLISTYPDSVFGAVCYHPSPKHGTFRTCLSGNGRSRERADARYYLKTHQTPDFIANANFLGSAKDGM